MVSTHYSTRFAKSKMSSKSNITVTQGMTHPQENSLTGKDLENTPCTSTNSSCMNKG